MKDTDEVSMRSRQRKSISIIILGTVEVLIQSSMKSKTPCFYESRISERGSRVEQSLIHRGYYSPVPLYRTMRVMSATKTSQKNTKNPFPRTLSVRALEEGKTTGCGFFRSASKSKSRFRQRDSTLRVSIQDCVGFDGGQFWNKNRYR